METKPQPKIRELDEFEQLIAEIVADPEVRAEMLKIQQIDVQDNSTAKRPRSTKGIPTKIGIKCKHNEKTQNKDSLEKQDGFP